MSQCESPVHFCHGGSSGVQKGDNICFLLSLHTTPEQRAKNKIQWNLSLITTWHSPYSMKNIPRTLRKSNMTRVIRDEYKFLSYTYIYLVKMETWHVLSYCRPSFSKRMKINLSLTPQLKGLQILSSLSSRFI